MTTRTLPTIANPAASRPQNLAFEPSAEALARFNGGLQAAANDDNTISIYDVIGSDGWSEGITAKRVAGALRAIGSRDVVVNINSPGGDVFEGIAIYNLLRDHPHNVTVRVVGLAASAASLIAMAGDEIQMARSGFMMIHNVWVIAMGNRHDLRAAAEWIEPFDDALADVYAARTGGDKAVMAALMDKETWLSGAQAIDQGFADDYMPADQVEEKEPENPDAFALRRVENIMARQGVPRSERYNLLSAIRGPRDTARSATGTGARDPAGSGNIAARDTGEQAWGEIMAALKSSNRFC